MRQTGDDGRLNTARQTQTGRQRGRRRGPQDKWTWVSKASGRQTLSKRSDITPWFSFYRLHVISVIYLTKSCIIFILLIYSSLSFFLSFSLFLFSFSFVSDEQLDSHIESRFTAHPMLHTSLQGWLIHGHLGKTEEDNLFKPGYHSSHGP